MQTFIASFGGAFTGGFIGGFLGWTSARWYYDRWYRRKMDRKIEAGIAQLRDRQLLP